MDENCVAFPSKELNSVHGAKRKVGRPTKVQAKVVKMKRKVGRPRKVRPEQMQTKRKVGRPRKATKDVEKQAHGGDKKTTAPCKKRKRTVNDERPKHRYNTRSND